MKLASANWTLRAQVFEVVCNAANYVRAMPVTSAQTIGTIEQVDTGIELGLAAITASLHGQTLLDDEAEEFSRILRGGEARPQFELRKAPPWRG